MKKECFTYSSVIDAPAEEVFNWHARPGASERLSPPWERVEVIHRTGLIEEGSQIELSFPVGPFRVRWLLEHCDIKPGRQFCLCSLKGPFAYWKHFHRFIPQGKESCLLEDHIEYLPPLGRPGAFFGGKHIRTNLEKLFAYRHLITRLDIAAHRGGGRWHKPLKVLITGSSGLIGSALVPLLTAGGHTVRKLVRSRGEAGKDALFWNPAAGETDSSGLESLDVVIHLAGESVAIGRWTSTKMERIRASRIDSTRLLIETFSVLDQPPRSFICASATGFYGDRGDEILDEGSEPGSGFMSEVCREWEQAAQKAADKGTRVVNLRFGMVLSPRGGALASMLHPFRLGAGGKFGSGCQFVSWIAIDDAVRAIYHTVTNDSLSGPVNLVSPNPLPNREFTRALALVLRRPAVISVPAPALKILLGRMADELLLASCRAVPLKLVKTGFSFAFDRLEDALGCLLGKTSALNWKIGP